MVPNEHEIVVAPATGLMFPPATIPASVMAGAVLPAMDAMPREADVALGTVADTVPWRRLAGTTSFAATMPPMVGALLFRTNDDVPGNGHGAVTCDVTLSCAWTSRHWPWLTCRDGPPVP